MIASLCGPDCGVQLFVHVTGAILLVGAVGTVALLAFAGQSRWAFTILLAGVWPAYIAMRVGAQLVLSDENLDDSKATWIGVGFGVSDGGILVLLLLTLFAWLARRRAWAGSALAWLSSLYLVALGVAWFFMSAKPS